MSTDNDRFRRYEEDFLNSTKIISRSMRLLENANGNVDAVISASVEVEGELSEAEGYVRAMDVEFRNMTSDNKRSAQTKVGEYKEEYGILLKKYQSAKRSAESQVLYIYIYII
jgi:hypothetical protein